MKNPEYVLLHLIKHLDLSVNIQNICSQLENHPDYPSMLALSDTLNEWDINNVAIELGFDDMGSISTPFIAYLNTNNGEFVLITAMDDEVVKLSNEWWNNRVLPLENFRPMYSGILLAFEEELILRSKKFDKNKHADNKQEIKTEALTPKALPWDVTFADIGASFGLSPKWEQYVNDERFGLIMVEPNNEQADKLRTIYPKAKLITYGLGNKNEKANINITLSQACSSILEPDMEVLDRFPIKKYFQITGQLEIMIDRYDDIARQMDLKQPDFIKIDVQGFEYEVLEGFGDILENVLAIEMEAHLVPIYKNEKLLPELNSLLNEKGFYLRHIESVGSFEGEVVEFDVYFVKRDTKSTTKKQRDMIAFWETLNQIPDAKRCLA